MGRRPNSLILQYFERGPKLADNSNRYPHTCKACGENFPKGRIDSLTNHLTKKCPAISEADRINACLTLHGINHAANRAQKSRQLQPNGPSVDLPMIQRDWTALETLAEVSRQIEANEKQPTAEDRGLNQAVNGNPQPAVAGAASASVPPYAGERFELHDQFTFENTPANASAESQQFKTDNGK
jgi:cell pole-organizing protein PopZ